MEASGGLLDDSFLSTFSPVANPHRQVQRGRLTFGKTSAWITHKEYPDIRFTEALLAAKSSIAAL